MVALAVVAGDEINDDVEFDAAVAVEWVEELMIVAVVAERSSAVAVIAAVVRIEFGLGDYAFVEVVEVVAVVVPLQASVGLELATEADDTDSAHAA